MIQIFLADERTDGRTNGPTEGSTRGPRGPKKGHTRLSFTYLTESVPFLRIVCHVLVAVTIMVLLLTILQDIKVQKEKRKIYQYIFLFSFFPFCLLSSHCGLDLSRLKEKFAFPHFSTIEHNCSSQPSIVHRLSSSRCFIVRLFVVLPW